MNDFVERNGPEFLCIDADIELPGEWLQAAMGVAMQIDRLLAHLVPGPERVVAQNEVISVFSKLDIVMNAIPSLRSGRCLRVVVADDQVLAPVQLCQQLSTVAGPCRHHVAEMPDFVNPAHCFVPVSDQRSVMFGHAGKRSPIEAENAPIAEMCVASKVDHRRYLGLLAPTSTREERALRR